ncbi:cyclophilin-like fold protein [Streptomyces niveus]|uniref:cyclophilin-like fold protein n=1 Tax=Streptomyces niveus TaxID=193462 RepID=UPI00084C7ADF|nr:cyclophilin-like fold protein [Streptomyces niveus]
MAALEFVVILGCALLVAGALAHRLRVAAPVLQLAAGVLLGFVPALRGTELPPDVLLLVFLPLLLYWESVTTSLRAIRRDLRGIMLTDYQAGQLVYWPPGPGLAVYYEHAGPPVPGPGMVALGTIDEDLDAFTGLDRAAQVTIARAD